MASTKALDSKNEKKGKRDCAPTFIIKPRRQFADEGTVAKFKASFDGHPPPSIKWDKDGTAITPDSRIKTLENGDFHFLEIHDIGTEDKGNYTCHLSNSHGSIKASATLEVYATSRWKMNKNPPKIEKKLNDMSVVDGDKLILECTITGSPDPNISWMFNDKEMKLTNEIKQTYNGRIAKLSFPEVFPEDAGKYECIAKNTGGEVKTQCNVQVADKPKLATKPSKQTPAPQITSKISTKLPDKQIIDTNGVTPKTQKETMPLFTKSPENMKVIDGTPVVIECSVIGQPKPNIRWFKGQKEIKHSPDFNLSYDGVVAKMNITEVYPEDDGEYTIIAENSLGKAECTCKVTVEEEPLNNGVQSNGLKSSEDTDSQTSEDKKAPPPPSKKPTVAKNNSFTVEDKNSDTSVAKSKTSQIRSSIMKKPAFIRRLQHQKVNDGDRVELIVEVQGGKPMDIIWLHNDKEIKKNNSVYKMISEDDVHKLIIEEVFPEDGGVYLCEVYNEAGECDCTCNLKVLDQVPDAENAEDVTDNGNANYEVNDDECFPPEFVKTPKSCYVSVGAVAKFEGCIIGNPNPNVTWEKDGVKIKPGGRIKLVTDGDEFTLEISSIKNEDAGRYTVSAVNNEGKIKCVASLNVKEIDVPEHIDFRGVLRTKAAKKPKSLERFIDTTGDQVDFRTNITKQAPVRLDDLEIKPEHIGDQVDFRHTTLQRKVVTNEMYSRAPGSQGEQVDFRQSTIGTYGHEDRLDLESEINTDGDQVDFREVLTRKVETRQRPKILQDLQDVTVHQNCHVNLECLISGIPPPKIKWYHESKEIRESKYFHMTFENEISSLSVAEVCIDDEGFYYCHAYNEAGTASTKCEVIVIEVDESENPNPELSSNSDAMEPPMIEDLSPDNIHIPRSENFVLKGVFQGEPRPTIKWFIDKKEIIAGERIKINCVRDTSTLTIFNAAPSDSGRYTLVVQNELGCDTCSSSVTIEDVPSPPVGCPVASNIAGTTLTLSWSGPAFDGGSSVTQYRVECKKVSDLSWKILTSTCKNTSYEVKSLNPNTQYHFRISASNKHGYSDHSDVSENIFTINQPLGKMRDTDEGKFDARFVTIDEERKFADHFQLEEEIGKGRFGSVFKCVEKKSKCKLAAKFIRIKASNIKDEIRQEITVMNSLRHQKLLMLYDAFESRREIILVMEHIGGGELLDRIIDDDYTLTERECVYFMKQICSAVAYMHAENILHLDLKPENILCISRSCNEIKIIDFGLARFFDPKVSTKILFGTPEFVAPEVVNYEQISHNTDMWSIGIIAYILISGLSPFQGENDNETLSNVTGAMWDFEEDIFTEVSEEAKHFISGLLKKNHTERRSAEDCLNHEWLKQELVKAKRLNTDKHKSFMARRKWQGKGKNSKENR